MPADLAGVSLIARPLRLGLLVPEMPGLPWHALFAAALSSQVRVWGGSQTLVLPLPDRDGDHDLFWALVDRFDVDWWSIYVPSHDELVDLDPQADEAWRSQVQTHLAGLPADAQAAARRDAGAVPLLDLELPDELNRLLVARAAAFSQDGIVQTRGPVNAVDVPYPLTDVLELTPLPLELVDPRAPAEPVLRLLLAAEVGLVSSPLRERLAELPVAVRSVDVTERRTLLRWVYAGQRSPGMMPFAFAEQGLAWFGAAPRTETTLTVVVGEGPWDFALAYALRRARSLAYWWPEGAFTSRQERDAALRALVRHAEQTGVPLVITSATAASAALALAGELPASSPGGLVSRLVSWRDALPDRPNACCFATRSGCRRR